MLGGGSTGAGDQNGFVSAKIAQCSTERQGEADRRGENETEKQRRCQSSFVADGSQLEVKASWRTGGRSRLSGRFNLSEDWKRSRPRRDWSGQEGGGCWRWWRYPMKHPAWEELVQPHHRERGCPGKWSSPHPWRGSKNV